MKKADDKWKICAFCKYIKHCYAGQGRIQELPPNPHAVNEIGCFDYEIYKRQLQSKQLGFFK